MALLSRRLYPQLQADHTSPDYNSEDFQSELFPLHSQLLRESWLVSFPPPSYMLKFSGYSWLIGGPIEINERLLRWLSTFMTRNDGISRPDSLHKAGSISELSHLHSHRWMRWPAFLIGLIGVGGDEQTLQQTYSPKEVQDAFKVLMTHWFCNSHDVSHFTAFFIDVGAKTSIAESVFHFILHPIRFDLIKVYIFVSQLYLKMREALAKE